MQHIGRRIGAAAGALALLASAFGTAGQTAAPTLHWTNQGAAWTDAARQDFYTRYQGSQLMPLSWMRALTLKASDGSSLPFLADGLARYGYLPNPASPQGLPIGFTVSPDADPQVGMTCAACHTRQLELAGASYRVDGGPAIVDFERFIKDLDDAVGAALSTDAAFAEFAHRVIGPAATPTQIAQLRIDVDTWFQRYHALISLAVPGAPSWGYSRADAVQMIFDRLTGLDIGKSPSGVIVGNIKLADTPVRYPFLWNAATESKTQWMGFADNGADFLGMLRNLGQVIGVFADFRSKAETFGTNYWSPDANSISISGLGKAEALMKDIGPPRWPWAYNSGLAAQGKFIFKRQCSSCHGDPDDASTGVRTTPIVAVGTDTRQFALLARTADTGVMENDWFPLPRLQPNDAALSVLVHAVGGTYAQSLQQPNSGALAALTAPALTPGQMTTLAAQANAPAPGYEARRLRGVWAAAPYLHNGSVPTLADLLKPAAQRPKSFLVGPEFDPATVGLSLSQPHFSSTTQTTDCTAPDSGNSRCGHEYGTSLSPPQKAALLEYLKIL